MVGREQIQQVSTVAQDAADELKEITERLKEAMATIKTQQTTISTLSNTNKQLADTNAEIKKGGGTRGNPSPKNRDLQRKKEEDEGEVTFAKYVISIQKILL
jgi:hypothetical protein